ncbi:MAG: hypothetical protein RL757_2132 [Bacteroidota bacterium]|jgi:diacylglycerol kinase (ATP)
MSYLRNRIKSFGYAINGVKLLLTNEPHARIHVAAAILATGAGAYFQISAMEWVAIVMSIAIVLAAEGFNTAIELLTDLVSPNYHELAGKTKDVAAGAVLLTAMGAALVGVVIFLPKLIALF